MADDEKKIVSGEEEVDDEKKVDDDAEAGEDKPAKNKKESEDEKENEGGGDSDEEDKEDDKEEKEPDVPVRRSAAQQIIARKNRTIDKLRSKTADDETSDDEDDTEEDDDEALTPAARLAINRQIKKAVTPIIGSVVSTADEAELKELYSTDPAARKLDKRIRAYMANPHYKGVPPSVIYHHLAFDAAAQGGAKKKEVADAEAKHQRGGGRTLRPKHSDTGNIPSVDEQEDMSDEDFEKLQHDVRVGKFSKKE